MDKKENTVSQETQEWLDEMVDATASVSLNEPAVKKCRKCGKILPVTHFGGHPKSKDGRLAECKVCRGGKVQAPTYTPRAVPPTISPIERYNDKQLADELRSRGYCVTALKTIEL